MDPDVSVRVAAVSLAAVIHRQGLVLPQAATPFLLAACADRTPAVGLRAADLLGSTAQKNVMFVLSPMTDGLAMMHRFISTVLQGQCTSVGWGCWPGVRQCVAPFVWFVHSGQTPA